MIKNQTINLGDVVLSYGEERVVVGVAQSETSCNIDRYVVSVPLCNFKKSDFVRTRKKPNELFQYVQSIMECDASFQDWHDDEIIVVRSTPLGVASTEKHDVLKQLEVGKTYESKTLDRFKVMAHLLMGAYGEREVYIGVMQGKYQETFLTPIQAAALEVEQTSRGMSFPSAYGAAVTAGVFSI